MSDPTFYQQAMADVKDFLTANGFDDRDPRIGHLQRQVNAMVSTAWRAGRDGLSLNEPLPSAHAEPTAKETTDE